MMVIYDPFARLGYAGRAWTRDYFDGCFGDRREPSLSTWVVPGTWPAWAL